MSDRSLLSHGAKAANRGSLTQQRHWWLRSKVRRIAVLVVVAFGLRLARSAFSCFPARAELRAPMLCRSLSGHQAGERWQFGGRSRGSYSSIPVGHTRCSCRVRPPLSMSADSSTQDATSTGDGIAIIAGTAIGGGFLALPTVTAPIGFLPSTAGLFAVWVLLVLTGITYAEACIRTAEQTLEEDSAGCEDELTSGASIVSVSQRALGRDVSVLCSIAFAAQMFAVLTAQIVKSGEILATVTGLPYALGCLLPSALVGIFTFCSRARLVEQTNTALAVTMVVGFAVLMGSTLANVGSTGLTLTSIESRLAFASWGQLLPSMQSSTSWVLPVFVNLLCFGQSVPLVVEKMGTKRPNAIRAAVVAGSGLPLILCVIWTAISTSLLDPASALGDPVLRMLTQRPEVSVPVGCIAVGAIGTTLIASYLSMGQFVTDAFCSLTGGCSLRDRDISCACTVALPAMLACAGPGSYIPLLAFSGAFPTTVLYLIMPPLALLVLRQMPRSGEGRQDMARQTSTLLPGGPPLLSVLIAVGVCILGISMLKALGVVLPLSASVGALVA